MKGILDSREYAPLKKALALHAKLEAELKAQQADNQQIIEQVRGSFTSDYTLDELQVQVLLGNREESELQSLRERNRQLKELEEAGAQNLREIERNLALLDGAIEKLWQAGKDAVADELERQYKPAVRQLGDAMRVAVSANEEVLKLESLAAELLPPPTQIRGTPVTSGSFLPSFARQDLLTQETVYGKGSLAAWLDRVEQYLAE